MYMYYTLSKDCMVTLIPSPFPAFLITHLTFELQEKKMAEVELVSGLYCQTTMWTELMHTKQQYTCSCLLHATVGGGPYLMPPEVHYSIKRPNTSRAENNVQPSSKGKGRSNDGHFDDTYYLSKSCSQPISCSLPLS